MTHCMPVEVHMLPVLLLANVTVDTCIMRLQARLHGVSPTLLLVTALHGCDLVLQGPAESSGGIWEDDSSISPVSRQAGGVSSCYTGSLSREQAVLKLQAGARGYLTRKQLRRQLQQQQEVLVLVQVGYTACLLAEGCWC